MYYRRQRNNSGYDAGLDSKRRRWFAWGSRGHDPAGDGRLVRNRENCLVVPTRDVAGMAAAVEELIEDRNLRQRLGKAGYATAQGMCWASASAAFEAALFQAIAEANHSKAAVP